MKTNAFCAFPFTRVRVTCEGNVAMCCFMRPDPMKSEKDAYIGNVLENNFDDIWHGDVAEAIRSETLDGKLHKKCQTPGCPFFTIKPPYQQQSITYNEYPTFLEIDLPNTHCNVGGKSPDAVKSPACIMCERSSPLFRPETDRLFDVLKKIKSVVPNLHQIHVQGIAEPLYQTKDKGFLLFKVLDALDFDEYSDKITLSITTNGTLFKKDVRAEYLRRVPHSITNFSIDAATPETFKNIRIFDCFDKVLENLYGFSKERIRNRQFLRIHNNINTMNVDEVLGMVHIAHQANVEYVEFSPTDGFNRKILVDKTNCGKFKKAQDQIIEECKRLGVPYNFIRPLDLGLANQLAIL